MTAAVVSAIFGAYDQAKPIVPQSVDCTFTMVTDNPDLKAPGWDLDVRQPSRNPRMIAKGPKLRPWKYAAGDGPWIWIDGSFQIVSPTFVEEVITATADRHPIAQWQHNLRTCIYPEAEFSATLPKYADTPVLEQAAHYRAAGHPVRWGLWNAGLIVYKAPVDDLADRWWTEMERWGIQDQISQPVALRATGMYPASLPGGVFNNPWFRLVPHADGTC